MITLEMIFDDPDILKEFMTWLDGMGEQYFWEFSEQGSCADFKYDYKQRRVLINNTCKKE